MEACSSMQTRSIFGSSETEAKALAVIPRDWPSLATVTTVTPVANRPITSRNPRGSIASATRSPIHAAGIVARSACLPLRSPGSPRRHSGPLDGRVYSRRASPRRAREGDLMPTVDVQGRTVHYEFTGEGPRTVVWTHGIGSSLETWRPHLPQIPGYRHLTYSVRGMGESQGIDGPVALEDWASDLAGLMDALDIPSAIVGGHSMGGAISHD